MKSLVNLRFKTYAEDGLIFFAGDEKRDFISIELLNGEVLYQYDLGGGRAELQNPMKVNDGEWHEVQVNRLNKTGYVFVDGEACKFCFPLL